MSDVTPFLRQIESGDPSAAEALLPLVYDELAVVRLAQEDPGQTVQATALVHEACVRLRPGIDQVRQVVGELQELVANRCISIGVVGSDHEFFWCAGIAQSVRAVNTDVSRRWP